MQRICGRLLAAIVLWAAVGAAWSGVPEVARFRLLGVREGLPSSTVNGLARDRAGFLWVATADGLARYDGIAMQVWRHVPGDPRTLSSDVVNAVHVDEHDEVWAASVAGGVDVLDAARRVRHVRVARLSGAGQAEVIALASRPGETWLGTLRDGLVRIDAAGGQQRFSNGPGTAPLPTDCVLALEVDAAGGLWAGTRDGLMRWDGYRFRRVPLPGTEPDAIVYAVRWLDGALWVGSDTGVHRFSATGWSTPAWSAMFARSNVALDFASDGGSRLWIGSQRALWHVEPGQVPHRLDGEDPSRVASVPQLLREPDGALWVPRARQGLGYLRADWRHFAEYGRAQGLRAEAYLATAAAPGGGVWLLGDDGTLDLMDGDGRVQPAPEPVARALEGHAPTSLAADAEGGLWLGEWDALLHVDAAGRLRRWQFDDARDGALGGRNSAVAVAADGSVWVASSGNGVQQRDGRSGRVLRQSALLQPGQTLAISALALQPDGTPWLAVNGPLLHWPAAGALRRAPVDAGEPTALAFDGASTLWAHRPGVLEQYRREGTGWTRVRRLDASAGVPEAGSNAMTVDRAHRVWLATARGLFRYDPARGQVRRFGLDDGLQGQEFTANQLSVDAAGVLVTPLESGGVLRLDTRAADPRATAGRLRVDAVQTRRDGVWQPLDAAAPVLDPQDRELRVQLRLPAFANPQSVRYATRLAGYDRGWVDGSGADPGERVFAGLPPGRYTLHARAVQVDTGRRSEATLQVRVLPPWWRTGAALAGFALALLGTAAAVAYAAVQRRRRRERLRTAERERALAQEASLAKTRFLSTLGHEVRTPMTGVLGMTELLLDTPLDERQRQYVDVIRGAGEHLLEFVNDALELARIEAGRLEIDELAFELPALLREVERWIQPLAAQRGLHFDLQLHDGLPRHVRGDAVRLRQILLNLLGNALKFTAAGNVWLHARAGDGGVVLEVGDTGAGMDRAQCERLFQRFEQAEGARAAAAYGSSGLGLAICRELAVAMGGSLRVESARGIGTRFFLELPLPVDAQAQAAAPAEAPPSTSAAHGPPRRVLLVEDDPAVAQVLTGLLQAQGHGVTHTAHGLAALAAIATQNFDLALLDLDLPGLDGCGLARQLRLLGFDMPLVAVTARADREARAQAQAAGFDRFVRKPVSGEQLRELLGGLRRRAVGA